MLALSLLALALALTASKVAPGFSRRWVVDVALGGLIATVAASVRAATRRLPKFTGALLLDAHHRLADRMTNALSFADLPPTERELVDGLSERLMRAG